MKKSLLFAAAAVVLPTAALAQPAPKPAAPAEAAKPEAQPTAKQGSTVREVVVTGQSNGTRVDIDRRSYNVANDLQATSGSIGDALRNIPSVEVDVQGNISLRGDSNVTIMIDGKPSGMFKGEGRGDALQRVPADQIERVEVITNPSAAFNPEGTAGVINLVTKKAKGIGASGTLRATYGSSGRWNAGVNGGYNSKKLSMTADLSVRHDGNKLTVEDERKRINPVTGEATETRQKGLFNGDGTFVSLRSSADYEVSPKLRVGLEIGFFNQDFTNRTYDHFETTAPSGALASMLDRVGRADVDFMDGEAQLTFTRKFSGDGHELTGRLDREVGHSEQRRAVTNYFRFPAGADALEDLRAEFTQRTTLGKLEYKRAIGDSGKLTSGYEFQLDDNDYDAFGFRGLVGATPARDPLLENHFRYKQDVHSLYATYQQTFGDFTAQCGLRLEQVMLDLTELTLNFHDESDYFRAYPSLHLSYKLNDKQQLTASYSHRIQRPQPFELNPYRIYQDPFNFREGNPRLKPSETHSYELGYQFRSGGTMYLATAYYREKFKEPTDVVTDLGGGVLVTRRENLGESRNGGLELVANGKLSKTITYNLSANAYWQEIAAQNLGFAGTRSGTTVSGRASLNWQVTPKDFVQVFAMAQGKTIIPQGERSAGPMVHLGYRHKFNEKISGFVQVTDVFDSFKQVIEIDTPTLKDRIERKPNIRAINVGFTYNFGSGPRRRQPEGFDFGGAPAAPQ